MVEGQGDVGSPDQSAMTSRGHPQADMRRVGDVADDANDAGGEVRNSRDNASLSMLKYGRAT